MKRQNQKIISSMLSLILLGSSPAFSYDIVGTVQFTSTNSMKLAENSDNLYGYGDLSAYQGCDFVSGSLEWTNIKNLFGTTPTTLLSFQPILKFKSGNGSFYDRTESGFSLFYDQGGGSIFTDQPLESSAVTASSRIEMYFKVPLDSSLPAYLGGPNNSTQTILSVNTKVGLVCHGALEPQGAPSAPTFVSNTINNTTKGYGSIYSLNLTRVVPTVTALNADILAAAVEPMDNLELKGLSVKRYNVSYSITSAYKQKAVLTLGKDLGVITVPYSDLHVNIGESDLTEGTYQTRVSQKDLALNESVTVNKTFSINPIRKPTAASVVVNPNKTININWTAPLKTANGVNIDISTWSGYHFYVYNSVQKIAYAFQLASTTIKTFTSPIALAPGSYTVRIFPHLVNGGLGTGSDILNVVIP